MLFVIDVGNTNINYGVYDGEKLVASFRMMSKMPRTSDEYGVMILGMLYNNKVSADDIDGTIIVTVVPNVMHALRGTWRTSLKPELWTA